MTRFCFPLFLLGALLFSPLAASAQTTATPVGLSRMGYAPFSMVGRVAIKIGSSRFQGSGTVIQPTGVLTAGHVVYNADSADGPIGFVNVTAFQLAKYDGYVASVSVPTQKFLLGGYKKTAATKGANSVAAFNADLGAMKFSKAPAGGAYLGWWANPGLLNRKDVKNKWSLGYGAETHNGLELLISSAAGNYKVVTPGFYENLTYIIEGGMSGGPVATVTSKGDWLVIGVNVAGLFNTGGAEVGMGVHVLNDAAYNFIQTSLY